MLAPGSGEEAQEVICGPGGPPPRTDRVTAHQPQGGEELESGPGSWGRTGQRVEPAEWCHIFSGANLVKSGPGDSLGSRRGLDPGQHFGNVKLPR